MYEVERGRRCAGNAQGSRRETKFQWDCNFCKLLWTGMQGVQQGVVA